MNAKSSMLVHRPASDLYRAFVEPDQLTRFWLARASAPLVVGSKVEWEFMVPGAKDTIEVKSLEADKRIVAAFSDGSEVTWTFEAVDASNTIVRIDHAGLKDVENAVESTQGFTIVLCDLKLLLETGTSPNLVREKARLITMAS